MIMEDCASSPCRKSRKSTVYIIASTNRTGSYLLCEGLEATQIAGRPTESLTAEFRRTLCDAFYGIEMSFPVSMRVMVEERTGANGVFGAKIHWDQVEDIGPESGYEGSPYVFLLEEFPGARYIYLSREDTLAQAISLNIASQTGEWWRATNVTNPFKTPVQPIYNPDEILRIEVEIRRQCQAWENFFRVEAIMPLRMDYETLAAGYTNEVGRALEFLCLDPTAARTIPEPRLQRQTCELNKLWHDWAEPLRKTSLPPVLKPESASVGI
jgi:trehalose 2-sulfotransferase